MSIRLDDYLKHTQLPFMPTVPGIILYDDRGHGQG